MILPQISHRVKILIIQKFLILLKNKIIYRFLSKYLKINFFFKNPLLDFKIFNIFLNLTWSSTHLFRWIDTFWYSKFKLILHKWFFNIINMKYIILKWTYHLVSIIIEEIILCQCFLILTKVFFSIAFNSFNNDFFKWVAIISWQLIIYICLNML